MSALSRCSGSITWSGVSSVQTNRVRSTSCRATIAACIVGSNIATRFLPPAFAVYIATSAFRSRVRVIGFTTEMREWMALADLIGIDTCLAIMDVLYTGFSDSKYRPCPLLKKMVAAGRLGRKSGRGFYSYGG